MENELFVFLACFQIGLFQFVCVLIVVVGQWILWFTFCHILSQFSLCGVVHRLSLAVENVLAIESIFLPVRSVQLKDARHEYFNSNQMSHEVVEWCKTSLPCPSIWYWIRNWRESIDDGYRERCNSVAMVATSKPWNWFLNGRWCRGSKCRTAKRSSWLERFLGVLFFRFFVWA